MSSLTGGVVTALLLSSIIVTIQSLDYYSTFEAFVINNKRERCIGDCELSMGKKRCIVTWHGYEEECFSDYKTPTVHFMSLYNEKCVSDCDDFNEAGYDWCAISHNSWRKCKRRIALNAYPTYETAKEFVTCKDDCDKRGYSYYWCNGVNGVWQYCNPNDTTHYFDYVTESGSTCAGRCKLEKAGKPGCYNQDGKFEACYLNPSFDWELNQIDKQIHSECYFSEYGDDDEEMKWCHKSSRTRRAADDETENELFFQCDFDLDRIMSRQNANLPRRVVRSENSVDVITTNPNPIMSYTILPTLSYFTDHRPNLDLPINIVALITTYTLPARREGFNSNVNNNYWRMDYNLHHATGNTDERGHLLASRLGGPMEPYNVFPQPWLANRGPGSSWYGLETAMESFIRANPRRYIRFSAALSYETDDSHVLVHRPTAVMIRIRAYEGRELVDLHTGDPLVNGVQENIYENVFFSNNPDESCTPLPRMPNRRGRRQRF